MVLEIEKLVYKYDEFMNITLNCKQVTEIPKLSWIGSFDFDKNLFDVVHGTAVESDEKWLVEGVWDGDFRCADSHKTDNFFGSGVRIQDNHIYIVSSCALLDRLLYCFWGNRF